MDFVRFLFNAFISAFAFMFTLLTMWHLGLFLWGDERYRKTLKHHENIQNIGLSQGTPTTGVSSQTEKLLRNCLLIAVFILQHSVMASAKFKRLFVGTGTEVLYRSIYIFATSLTLQAIVRNWSYIPETILWHIDIQNSALKWWPFFLIHVFAWIMLYAECLLMDFGDLMGFKQVYYESFLEADCLELKSQELQTFYRHMRHPGFLSLSTVVWFHPIMSLDRLCLALFFMLYMMFRFRVEMDDYLYLEKQARIKREQIQSLVFHSMIR